MKMFDYRLLKPTKSPFFSTIIFLSVIFIIYADSIISTLSLQSPIFTSQTIEINHGGGGGVRVSRNNFRRQIKLIEEVDQVESRKQSSINSPFNLTKEQRISWFRDNINEFDILKSDELTQRFHGRVLEFFNNQCEVTIFVTWISPARSFGRREIIAMETIFKSHPNGCLTILSRTMDSPQGYVILKPLHDLGFKILAVTPDLPFLFKNTPAEAWFEMLRNGNKDPGAIPLAQNLSNLIRLAVLYKYGGVYMDTDFIVTKNFKQLRNSIGAQAMDIKSRNWTRLNNAFLAFDMNHPVLYKFMEEFALTFDGSRWGHNGPYLVSRVVRREEGKPGFNVTVLPPMAFYPVVWTHIGSLFKSPESRNEEKWVNAKLVQLTGETYGVHLWNKQSSRLIIEEKSVLSRLVSDYCVICEDVTILPIQRQ